MTSPDEAPVVWTPSPERIDSSRFKAFTTWLAAEGTPCPQEYQQFQEWVAQDLDRFWGKLGQWYGVRWHADPSAALASADMPGAVWFPGGELNYAEHALFPPSEVDPSSTAIIFMSERCEVQHWSWERLRAEVASIRAWLLENGVRQGDRVAGVLPNSPYAVVGLLASASIGAIWTCCSPEFGAKGILDRLSQVNPSVLLVAPEHQYGGKTFDNTEVIGVLQQELASVRATVLATDSKSAALPNTLNWHDIASRPGSLEFASLPFDAPLHILYSSGTTGLPKAIVHGHGGIVLEHVKQLALHFDLGPGDRFFWYTTTGWMMWNLVVSGLLVGTTIVLFDGSPGYPESDSLWALAEKLRITSFGVSSSYLQNCMKQSMRPKDKFDLSSLHTIGSTGSPLPAAAYHWVYKAVGDDLMLASASGGTDVCSAFVGGVPVLPVRAGEITTRLLGCLAEAYSEDGKPTVGQVGELVVTAPLPSMPLMLYNDADGSRLREAYFDTIPGVWRHGDWVKFTAHGSCIIYGRSDATLNRGGIRIGTNEFYSVADEAPGVLDSLVIDTSRLGVDGKLLLFVVLEESSSAAEVTQDVLHRIKRFLSARYAPDAILVVPAIPYTLTGKKCEVPIKKILTGTPSREAVDFATLRNPEALEMFEQLAAREESTQGNTH